MLLDANLVDIILPFTDPARPDFRGFPTTNEQTAANWGEIAFRYFSQATNPFVPAGHLAARPIFESAMLAGLTNVADPMRGITALQNGFAAYVLALVPFGLPAVIIIPPPAPLVLTPGVPTLNAVVAAYHLVVQIDIWAHTGLTTTPIGTPTLPWL